MIRIDIGGCAADILPVICGLVSEYDRVKEHITDEYDTFAVSLGKEDIIAVGLRDELEEDTELEDVDMVYLHYLGKFGDTRVPAPAFSALVDGCSEMSKQVMPLDMDEESYSKIYCEMITTFELLGEGRLAKKAMRKEFDMSSAESFVVSWDEFVNRPKGFLKLARLREKYMANRIRMLARTSERMLAVVAHERINGIMSVLKGDENVIRNE